MASVNRGTLKPARPVPLRQTDIDALLGTAVAPMQIDKKSTDEAYLNGATNMNVRFLLKESVGKAGDEKEVGGHLDDSEEKYETTANGDRQPTYFEPRPSRNTLLNERLERMFGAGRHTRGVGAKPKKVCHMPKYILLDVLSDFGLQGAKEG